MNKKDTYEEITSIMKNDLINKHKEYLSNCY